MHSDFAALGLDPALLDALHAQGMTEPTPIQAQALPLALAGRDVVGLARTGSGKTLAFVLPLLQGSAQALGGLVLAPTRELALQVHAVIEGLVRGASAVLVGGMAYGPQREALRRGPRVVVGTPGRLRDLLERGALPLGAVATVVLDEADEMLRMGFAADLERLLDATPAGRQVLMFSATMSPDIEAIARRTLSDPARVAVEEQVVTVHHIEQCWMRVPARHKLEALQLLVEDVGTALVFANTRVEAEEVAEQLGVACLHGGLSQAARQTVLDAVRSGSVRVLVATDVAARGIDVAHIALVVNLDLPETPERYVHRIGRTGRAGAAGRAVTLVTPKKKRRIRELAHELGIELPQGEVPAGHDGAPPAWARPVPAVPATVEDLDAAVLLVLAGTAHQLGAADLVAALSSRGVARSRIGRIRIGKRTTRVGLPEDAAELVLSAPSTLPLLGRQVAVHRSQDTVSRQ